MTGDAGLRLCPPVPTTRVPASAKHDDYLPSLTGLRFVLAVWVILDHLTGTGLMPDHPEHWLQALTRTFLDNGYLAVETFFILSGFVLARSYANVRWNRDSLIRYASARFARVYPAYFLSLLVVSRFILETLAKPTRTAAVKAGLLANYAFVLLGWTGSLSVGWNTPAWTLSCEIFFYLCFPLLFLWMRKQNLSRIAAALAISLMLPVVLVRAGVPGVWKPVHHLVDFLAGIAAAGLFDLLNRHFPWLRRRGFLLYLPALSIAMVFIGRPQLLNGMPVDLNTVLRPLNVLLLTGLGFGDAFLAYALALKPVEYLGRVSYCMYILHVPLLWWFGRYSFHLPGHGSNGWNSVLFLFSVIAISIAGFELVEMPANRWIRRCTAARLASRAHSGILQAA